MTTKQSSSIDTQASILDIVRPGSSRKASESAEGSFKDQPALEGVFSPSSQSLETSGMIPSAASAKEALQFQSVVYLTPFSAPALAALAAGGALKTAQPSNTGRLTGEGAPDIRLSDTPQASSLGYTGPAALNPYFTSPENPLRAGFVSGFDRWFAHIDVHSSLDASRTYEMNPLHNATSEGAEEALRLIRMFDPGAQATEYRFGGGGGPYAADGVTREITLSDGTRLNAGNILNYYYNGSAGVTAGSDQMLARLVTRAG